jgi:hypothetical protein
MKSMRFCLCFLLFCGLLAAAGQPATLTGRLVIESGKPSAIESARKRVALAGDDSTMKVLGDPRLNGFEAEVRGRFTAPDRFELAPFHTHALLIRKDGRWKQVTYFCDVCNIRAYTPGQCVCCQRETELDLIDPPNP